jgi:calcium-dependent protein kinase
MALLTIRVVLLYQHNVYYLYISEFIAAAVDKSTLLSNEKLRKAFQVFDTDNSGTITLLELKQVFLLSCFVR